MLLDKAQIMDKQLNLIGDKALDIQADNKKLISHIEEIKVYYGKKIDEYRERCHLLKERYEQ